MCNRCNSDSLVILKSTFDHHKTTGSHIHKIAQYPQQWGRHNFRSRGAFRGGRHSQRGGIGGPSSRDKTTDTVLRLCVKTVFSGHTNPEKSAGPSMKSAFIVKDLGISQKCTGKIQTTSMCVQ